MGQFGNGHAFGSTTVDSRMYQVEIRYGRLIFTNRLSALRYVAEVPLSVVGDPRANGQRVYAYGTAGVPSAHKSIFFTPAGSNHFSPTAEASQPADVRRRSVQLHRQGASFRVSQLPRDDGVDSVDVILRHFSPHPSPIGRRLADLPTVTRHCMGERDPAGLLRVGFCSCVKKNSIPSTKSRTTDCQQVSEFWQFQRGSGGRRIPLCALLGFRIWPRSRNTECGRLAILPSDSRGLWARGCLDELLPIALGPTRNLAQ